MCSRRIAHRSSCQSHCEYGPVASRNPTDNTARFLLETDAVQTAPRPALAMSQVDSYVAS